MIAWLIKDTSTSSREATANKRGVCALPELHAACGVDAVLVPSASGIAMLEYNLEDNLLLSRMELHGVSITCRASVDVGLHDVQNEALMAGDEKYPVFSKMNGSYACTQDTGLDQYLQGQGKLKASKANLARFRINCQIWSCLCAGASWLQRKAIMKNLNMPPLEISSGASLINFRARAEVKSFCPGEVYGPYPRDPKTGCTILSQVAHIEDTADNPRFIKGSGFVVSTRMAYPDGQEAVNTIARWLEGDTVITEWDSTKAPGKKRCLVHVRV